MKYQMEEPWALCTARADELFAYGRSTASRLGFLSFEG